MAPAQSESPLPAPDAAAPQMRFGERPGEGPPEATTAREVGGGRSGVLGCAGPPALSNVCWPAQSSRRLEHTRTASARECRGASGEPPLVHGFRFQTQLGTRLNRALVSVLSPKSIQSGQPGGFVSASRRRWLTTKGLASRSPGRPSLGEASLGKQRQENLSKGQTPKGFRPSGRSRSRGLQEPAWTEPLQGSSLRKHGMAFTTQSSANPGLHDGRPLAFNPRSCDCRGRRRGRPLAFDPPSAAVLSSGGGLQASNFRSFRGRTLGVLAQTEEDAFCRHQSDPQYDCLNARTGIPA